MNAVELSEAAKVKGVNLLGSADFTHPKHLQDLKKDLTPCGKSFFKFNDTYFILTSEISLMYSQGGRGRKVHLVVLAPDFEAVDQLCAGLLKWGRLDYDGRPIFGKTCIEFMDLCLSISKDIEVIPAHAWTPYFGIFGSKSGFDSVEECFQDHAKHIHALETGLSSDPAMNWRLSKLDRYTLVSFSDSHSPYPWRLGREATVFDLKELSYNELIDAIRKKDSKKLLYTIETDPGYGKYHFDGHRLCNVSFSPAESKKHNNICPVCRKPLVLGVENRIEELADRELGFIPKNAIPFKTLIPLSEVIAGVLNVDVASKSTTQIFDSLMKIFGNELSVLVDASQSELERVVDAKIVDAILKDRRGEIKVKPGYDGEYGVPIFDESQMISRKVSQKTLEEF